MSEAAQATHSSPDGHIPQLRFPEFGKRWDKETIGGISKIFGRIGYRGYTVQDIVSKGEGAIALSPSNFINNQINTIKSTYISWFKYEESPEIKILDGDILFVKTGSTYGKTAFVSNIKEKATINPQIVVLKNISISNKFLGYIVTTQTIKKQIEQIVVGGAIPTMSQKELSKMEFSLPAKPEQQKIAAFLTAVDSKIEQLSKKKALLGEYKKGLMQQIFSQEIRFKADDGSDFPDWEEKKLGNISNVSKLAGYEFTKYIKYQDTGSIIALRGLNIKKNKLDLSVVKFIDNSDFSRLNRSKLFIDDLMFTYIGTIGEVALIDEDDKYYLAPNVSRIRFNNEVCLPRFAIQYFNREVFKQGEIKKYVSSSSQPALTMGNVRLFILNLPTKPEQQKIANFLSSIDSKIEQVGEQLDKSKQFKKALLQKMFV